MAQERRTSREQTPPPRRRKRRRRSAGAALGSALLYVVAVIGISVLLACVGWIAANDVLALNKAPVEVTLTIDKDDKLSDVTDILKEKGLIEYKFLFNLFAMFTHGEDKIAPGTYTLTTDMDYRALIANMGTNSATKAVVTVTIPEGYTVQQIFQLLEEKGVSTVEELNETAATHDYKFSFLQDIPLGKPERLEGYLYPDTYEFTTPHNTTWAINKMLVRFDEQFTDEMRQEVADDGRTIYEILTVASMIERETDGTDHEKIASVIYNRLNNPNSSGTNGYLQIDATLVYITGKEPRESDKDIDSPYNTYLYPGLPAGPIANPGITSIRAAMEPEKTSYYYYALGDDNQHHFFKTLKEHTNFLASQERYKTSG